jgi:hypothetical protein
MPHPSQSEGPVLFDTVSFLKLAFQLVALASYEIKVLVGLLPPLLLELAF